MRIPRPWTVRRWGSFGGVWRGVACADGAAGVDPSLHRTARGTYAHTTCSPALISHTHPLTHTLTHKNAVEEEEVAMVVFLDYRRPHQVPRFQSPMDPPIS